MQTEQLTILEPFEKGLTKLDIRNIADEIVERVLEEGDPLRAAEGLAALESFIKEVKDDRRFKDYVVEEAGKHKGGFVSNSGAKIECIEAGVKYDYSKCGDPKYLDYLQEVQDAEAQLKEYQKFLRSIPMEGIEVRRDDELVRIFPPSKSSTSTYKITLSK